MLENFLQSPASVYIVLLIIVLIILFIIAGILKFIIRMIFFKIKFSICVFIAFLAISIILGKFALAPIQKNTLEDEPNSAQVLQNASDQFKGIFSNSLPFLAWKFEEVALPIDMLDSMFSSSSSNNTNNAKIETNLGDQYIKVSYLPFGSVLLSYDEITQQFQLAKGLGEGDNSGAIDKLLQNINPSLLDSLPKPKQTKTKEK